MKIFILGLPASGKTTLAKKLSAERNIPFLELDKLFGPESEGKVQRLVFEDIEKELNNWLAREDWIIEGVYPIAEVMERADEIIVLKVSPLKCLTRQWSRFVTDKEQRRKYGLWRNLGLSFLVVSLSTGKWGVRIYRDSPRVTFPRLNQLRSKFGAKVKTGKS